MKTEEDIRLEGMDVQSIENAFIWQNLSKDLMIELIETDPLIKTKIDHHLIAALQGFASYPSKFFQNMYIYLKLDLAEQKQLKNYSDRVGEMYMNQLQKELESRRVYSLVDSNGTVKDQIII